MYALSLLLSGGLWISQALGWNDVSIVAAETRPSITTASAQPTVSARAAATTATTTIPTEIATAVSKPSSGINTDDDDTLLSSLTEKLLSKESPGPFAREDLSSTDRDRVTASNALGEEQQKRILDEPQQQKQPQIDTDSENRRVTPSAVGDSNGNPLERANFMDPTDDGPLASKSIAPVPEKNNIEELPRPLASMAAERATIGSGLDKNELPPTDPLPQTMKSARNDPSERERKHDDSSNSKQQQPLQQMQQNDVLTDSKQQQPLPTATSGDTLSSPLSPLVQQQQKQQPERASKMASTVTTTTQSVESQPADEADIRRMPQRWKDQSPPAAAELQKRFTVSEIPTEVRSFAAGSVLTAAVAFLYSEGQKYLPMNETAKVAAIQNVELKVTHSPTASAENNSVPFVASVDESDDLIPPGTSELVRESVIHKDDDCLDEPGALRNIRQIIVLPRKETDPTLSFTERTTYYRARDRIAKSGVENDENKQTLHPTIPPLAAVENVGQNDDDESPPIIGQKPSTAVEDDRHCNGGIRLHDEADKPFARVKDIGQNEDGVGTHNETDNLAAAVEDVLINDSARPPLTLEGDVVLNNHGAGAHNETENPLVFVEDLAQNNDTTIPHNEVDNLLTVAEDIVRNSDGAMPCSETKKRFDVMDKVVQKDFGTIPHSNAGEPLAVVDDIAQVNDGASPHNEAVQLIPMFSNVKEQSSVPLRVDEALGMADGTAATSHILSVDDSINGADDVDLKRGRSSSASSSLRVYTVADAAESTTRNATAQVVMDSTPTAQEVLESSKSQIFRFPAAKTPAAAQLVQRRQSLEDRESKQRMNIWPRKRKSPAVVVGETSKNTSILSASIMTKISSLSSSSKQIGETWWSREHLQTPKTSAPTSSYPVDRSPPH